MSEDRRGNESRSSLWDDPVVEEVRAARRKLWDAAGHDVRQFLARTREAEKRRAAERQRKDREAG